MEDLAQAKVRFEKKVEQCRYESLDLTEEDQRKIIDALKGTLTQHESVVPVNGGALLINMNTQLDAYLPFDWLARIRSAAGYRNVLQPYWAKVEELKSFLNRTGVDSDAVFRALPDSNWNTSLPQPAADAVNQFISSSAFGNDTERDRFRDYLAGDNYLPPSGGRKLNRGEKGFAASILKPLLQLVGENASKINKYFDLYLEDANFANLVDGFRTKASSISSHPRGMSSLPGENVIYYGAPGVGKSYSMKGLVTEQNSVVTVFHPETQYSDFVGSLKPRTVDDGSGKPTVTYEFRRGPFITALEKACSDPSSHFYLVIEEINRAPAAAVFGEIFQLLDREPSGQSSYSISVTDPDMLEALNKYARGALNSAFQLHIPSNLSIFATMNSSDQAVMPMDTAFKRRWKFKYLPIDFKNPTPPQGRIPLPLKDGSCEVDWKDFAQCINGVLADAEFPEDRQLGPWFLKPEQMSDSNTAAESLKGKVLLYLWEDVLRHEEKTKLFTDEVNSFGELVKCYDAGKPIFSDRVEEEFKVSLNSRSIAGQIEQEQEQEQEQTSQQHTLDIDREST